MSVILQEMLIPLLEVRLTGQAKEVHAIVSTTVSIG